MGIRDAVERQVEKLAKIAEMTRRVLSEIRHMGRTVRTGLSESRRMTIKPDIDRERARLASLIRMAQWAQRLITNVKRDPGPPSLSRRSHATEAQPPRKDLDRVYADAVARGPGGPPDPATARAAAIEGMRAAVAEREPTAENRTMREAIDKAAERSREDENAGWKPHKPERERTHETPSHDLGRSR